MSRILRDEHGEPLPFHMHPDTWRNLTNIHRTDGDHLTYAGATVIINDRCPPDQIIQFDETLLNYTPEAHTRD